MLKTFIKTLKILGMGYHNMICNYDNTLIQIIHNKIINIIKIKN